jgi:hypothetical protein
MPTDLSTQALIGDVVGATGHGYAVRDSAGHTMHTVKIIANPAGGYLGIYHTGDNVTTAFDGGSQCPADRQLERPRPHREQRRHCAHGRSDARSVLGGDEVEKPFNYPDRIPPGPPATAGRTPSGRDRRRSDRACPDRCHDFEVHHWPSHARSARSARSVLLVVHCCCRRGIDRSDRAIPSRRGRFRRVGGPRSITRLRSVATAARLAQPTARTPNSCTRDISMFNFASPGNRCSESDTGALNTLQVGCMFRR